ncbi:TetR/AcrR family transcriptional regulator [Flavobacterium pectinovorum]|uniref:TetR/AcrR family transcriptional regulator n=1 Tax=Flavobacterium pectinovorum TaxID=29533 RepID=A0A502EK07_9FLAO|nr:TetR/AcrR family transcriptional regulator [Flavobacterium pectinovorum]TPG37797.1 TetR/AcrR family transcriptional regulator [Flavobacterium pectinovorum]
MKANNKKIAILDIAEDLFCSYGSKNTTVRLISKKAKISPAMLNYYFGSKGNLSLLIFERKIKQLKGRQKELDLKNKTAIEQTLVYTNFYIDLIVEHLPFYRLMMKEKLLNENEIIVNLIDSYFKSNMETLRNVLNKGRNEKEIKQLNNDSFVMIVSGLLANIIFKTDNVQDVLYHKNVKQIKKQLHEVLVVLFVITLK